MLQAVENKGSESVGHYYAGSKPKEQQIQENSTQTQTRAQQLRGCGHYCAKTIKYVSLK